MTSLYTPICPITLAYTNLNHIFHIKKAFNPGKLILCVWDLFVLDDHRLQGTIEEKQRRLAENTDFLVRLARALGMDCKAIRLSEAWERVFKKSTFSLLLQRIMTRMTLDDIHKTFQQYPHIATEDFSLSMMNYNIVDYIVAAHLPEIFPELATSRPRTYVVSERFRPFEQVSCKILQEAGLLDVPAVQYTRGGPFVMDENRFFPSLGMSPERIHALFKSYVTRRNGFATDAERERYVDLLNLVLDDSFLLEGREVSVKRMLKALVASSPDELAMHLAANTSAYFAKAGGLARNALGKTQARHLFISDASDFQRQIRKLNWLKLRILRHCDGTSTCYEIARKLNLNPNTVAVYFSRLRAAGLISGDRRPKRTVQSIVIDLENINAEPPEAAA